MALREVAIGGSGTVAVSVPGFSSGSSRAGASNVKVDATTQQSFCIDPLRGGSFSALQGGSEFAVGARHAASSNRWTFEHTGSLTGDGHAAELPVAAGATISGAPHPHFRTADNPGAGTALGDYGDLYFHTADNPGAGTVLGDYGDLYFHTADNPGAGIVLGDLSNLDFHTADNPGAGIVLADFGGGSGNGGQNPVAQAVPDAGSTLLLFGVALLGVVGFGKRFGFGAAGN